MFQVLVRRLCFCAVLVILASSASLLLTRLAPGDLTTDLGPLAKSSQVTAARARFALDRPVVEQWWDWAGRAAHFDFGESFLYGRPVGPLVLSAAANTAVLAVSALALATLAGLGFGIITGSGRSGVLPAIVRVVSIAAVSLPPLLTSLALLFVAARTGWFPLGGMSSDSAASWREWVTEFATHLPLPALALALPVAATFERLQSSALNAEIAQPFVVAAAARGVSSRDLILKHAWRASLRSVTAIFGLVAGSLLSGSFVVEFVTAWPGIGRLMYEALRARDIYLVAGCAAVGSALLSVGMLLGDVLLALADPRIREGQ